MRDTRRALGIALGLNTGVILVEGASGLWANSLGLMMDAVHNLSDEMGIALLFLAYTLPSGLSRNLLRAGNLFNLLGLLILIALLLRQAAERIGDPPPVLASVSIAAGLLGAGLNWGIARALRRSSKEDPAIRLAYTHNLGDVLNSLGPVASGLLIIVTGSFLFDPLVALLIAGAIAFSTARTLVGSWRGLLWPRAVGRGRAASKGLPFEDRGETL